MEGLRVLIEQMIEKAKKEVVRKKHAHAHLVILRLALERLDDKSVNLRKSK